VNGVAVAGGTDVGAANELQTAGPGQREEDWRTGWARLETGVVWQPGIGEQVMQVAD
jgi:hypothetical protein